MKHAGLKFTSSFNLATITFFVVFLFSVKPEHYLNTMDFLNAISDNLGRALNK